MNMKFIILYKIIKTFTKMEIWELSYFLNDSDIIFEINNKIYNLNKYILGISPVLKKLWNNDFSEKNRDIIELTILPIEQWEIFLNYCYYQYCKFLDYEYDIKILEQFKNNYTIDYLSDIQIINLYFAADVLDVRGIKEKSEFPLVRVLRNIINNGDYDTFNDILSIVPDYIIDDFLYSIQDKTILDLLDFCKKYDNKYICSKVYKLLNL